MTINATTGSCREGQRNFISKQCMTSLKVLVEMLRVAQAGHSVLK